MDVDLKSSIQTNIPPEIHTIRESQIHFWKWMTQLGNLVHKKHSNSGWDLLGHGLIIETEDYDLTEQYAQLTCEYFGVEFQILDFVQLTDPDLLLKS